MRIPSGTTDQFVYFVAVDATDFTTRETGLTTFTAYRSRNGAAAVAFTTPTINEVDATNMPGVYELLLDEDMTIAAGNDSEEMVFHITQASMAPVSRVIELYRSKVTVGNTLGVAADGDLLEVNTVTGHTVQTGDSFARLGAPAGASVSADIAAVEGQTDDIGAAGAGLTAVPWNSAWDAEVQSEVQDAIEANHLDHLLAADYDADTPPGVGTALLNELVEDDGGVARFTANALEQAPTDVNVTAMNADVITAAALAADAVTEIWAEVVESEGSYTAQQIMSIILSVNSGRTSNGGNTFGTPNNNATRVTATTDGSNNRTAITLTPSS